MLRKTQKGTGDILENLVPIQKRPQSQNMMNERSLPRIHEPERLQSVLVNLAACTSVPWRAIPPDVRRAFRFMVDAGWAPVPFRCGTGRLILSIERQGIRVRNLSSFIGAFGQSVRTIKIDGSGRAGQRTKKRRRDDSGESFA
jgi:hypothetical protein